ncbi:MAG: PEP-CTERM sorting domain-containing protein [Caldimonas sp.]
MSKDVRVLAVRRSATAIGAAVLLALGASSALAAETTFAGYTDGCFGLGCTPPTTAGGTQTTSFQGLTYTASTFNSTTSNGFLGIGSAPGTPNFNNLGSFFLSTSPFTTYDGNFDVRVTFSAPAGTSPNTAIFDDVITGSVSSTGGGGVYINFDNTPKSFTFSDGSSSGSFTFAVNDLSITAGDRVAVTGTILSSVSPVPEPETYALMLAGLSALGFIGRRRRKS